MAQAGQIIIVKSIDENGVATETSVMDKSELINEMVSAYPVWEGGSF